MRGSILRTIVIGFFALTDAPNLLRDVEIFAYMTVQKFLMVILDNKVF